MRRALCDHALITGDVTARPSITVLRVAVGGGGREVKGKNVEFLHVTTLPAAAGTVENRKWPITIYLPLAISADYVSDHAGDEMLKTMLDKDINTVQPPARSLQDFLMWDSCRTMPLVSGFSRGSPVYPDSSFLRSSILISITSLTQIADNLAQPIVLCVITWRGCVTARPLLDLWHRRLSSSTSREGPFTEKPRPACIVNRWREGSGPNRVGVEEECGTSGHRAIYNAVADPQGTLRSLQPVTNHTLLRRHEGPGEYHVRHFFPETILPVAVTSPEGASFNSVIDQLGADAPIKAWITFNLNRLSNALKSLGRRETRAIQCPTSPYQGNNIYPKSRRRSTALSTTGSLLASKADHGLRSSRLGISRAAPPAAAGKMAPRASSALSLYTTPLTSCSIPPRSVIKNTSFSWATHAGAGPSTVVTETAHQTLSCVTCKLNIVWHVTYFVQLPTPRKCRGCRREQARVLMSIESVKVATQTPESHIQKLFFCAIAPTHKGSELACSVLDILRVPVGLLSAVIVSFYVVQSLWRISTQALIVLSLAACAVAVDTKEDKAVEKRGALGLGYGGYGGYGLGHGLGSSGYSGLGYSGLGYSGLGYGGYGGYGLGHGLGYSGLGYSGLGYAAPAISKVAYSAPAVSYAAPLGYHGLGYSGLGYSGLGYSGLGYSGLGYGSYGLGHGLAYRGLASYITTFVTIFSSLRYSRLKMLNCTAQTTGLIYLMPVVEELRTCALESSQIPLHDDSAADKSQLIKHAQVNSNNVRASKRAPYPESSGLMYNWLQIGAAANEQKAEAQEYTGQWSLAYRSFKTRNFPIPVAITVREELVNMPRGNCESHTVTAC
ncbi:hypothetical protein PR048_000442 [Dryococelus australis]|uniref:Uncharacterized protein n=1 Tax=Dryococelus australis TaxID=614101 RepID=A0ABQ9IF57_9NEOP|nr:hypothetical protein PR048_000442 [Dryococelus australis]